jgi:hypothetical protein
VPFDIDRLEAKVVRLPLFWRMSRPSSYGGGQLDFSCNGTLVYLSR